MAASRYVSGAFSGAGTGASAGAAFGPWGAAIGGGLGLVAGIFGAAAEEEDAEARRKILEQLSQDLDIGYNEIEQAFGEFYKQYDLAKAYGYTDENGNVDLTKLGAVGKKIQNWDNQVYKRMAESGMGEIDPVTGEFKYSEDKFSFDHDTNGDGKTDALDFVDPYMGNVINASNAAVQHSAAGAGLGRSTGAAKAIAENTAKEYDKLYNTALNQYNSERSQSYTEWSDYLKRQKDRLSTLLEADKWGIEAQKGLGDDFLNWASGQLENKTGLMQDKLKSKSDVQIALSQI